MHLQSLICKTTSPPKPLFCDHSDTLFLFSNFTHQCIHLFSYFCPDHRLVHHLEPHRAVGRVLRAAAPGQHEGRRVRSVLLPIPEVSFFFVWLFFTFTSLVEVSLFCSIMVEFVQLFFSPETPYLSLSSREQLLYKKISTPKIFFFLPSLN